MGVTLHDYEIVRVDSKGRITIPSKIREELGLQSGTYVTVRLERGENRAILSLFSGPDSRLIELHLMMPDRPGALARAAKVLGDANIDLLLSSSRTIRKGDLAEWVVVADASHANGSVDEVKKKILESQAAIEVDIKEFSMEG
ncbi:MAG: ACT domain-containing protein [Candidatus Verstraetearchaeota archaeon]|nr:ACT domain-containing protein [Candidatus Verstraetearchaeota archaeon]